MLVALMELTRDHLYARNKQEGPKGQPIQSLPQQKLVEDAHLIACHCIQKDSQDDTCGRQDCVQGDEEEVVKFAEASLGYTGTKCECFQPFMGKE